MSNIRTDLYKRLIDGRQIGRVEHKEQDQLKLGNLRAGNSGLMTKDGDIAGACHRVAHLRSLGLEIDPPDDSKMLMFQLGTINERSVYDDLVKTMAPNEVLLMEEEIPVEWFTENGAKVTGRPDMVVCEIKSIDNAYVNKPVFGIELKSIASVWTSRDIIGEQQPKMPHLIQAGHYSWQLGIPFRLVYNQYGIQEIPSWKGSKDPRTGETRPGWGQNLFPKEGEPGSEHIDYDKGRIKPFQVCFELEWQKDRLAYRREDLGGDWTKTLIKSEDIARFYEFTSRMAADQNLGPRPLTIDAFGKEKSYSNCSYCPLKPTCDKFEDKGYNQWLSEVKSFLEKD